MKRSLVGLVVLALAALPFATAGAQSGDARVRVLHASPDAPAVDVYVDGEEAISNLAFGSITDYVTLPAGTHSVEVFPASADGMGDAVIAADLQIAAGTDYTVAATNVLADIAPAVFVDDNTQRATGNARIRVIHLSPDAPAVDIAAAGAGTLLSGLAFPDASDYLEVPAGTYDLSVLPAGTDTVALPLPGTTVNAGSVITVFALGLLEGDPALRALPVADASYTQQATPAATPSAVPGPPHTGTGLASATADNDGALSWSLLAAGAALAVLGAGAVAGIALRMSHPAHSTGQESR
jgi:hypothetical protein